MPSDFDTVNGEDLLANSLRAIKQFIPARIRQVKGKGPVGDKQTPQYQLEAAYQKGYLQALTDLEAYIKELHC